MNTLPLPTTLRLATRSLWNRRGTAFLTIAAIAISVSLLLGVQMLRTAARSSFANTVSGVDLIVGARSGPLNLLLYSIFRVGDATANVSWASYQKIAHHPDVEWTIPISLGDSHRGFRVMGTNTDYFKYYKFADHRALQFTAGTPFSDLYDAVLGAMPPRAWATSSVTRSSSRTESATSVSRSTRTSRSGSQAFSRARARRSIARSTSVSKRSRQSTLIGKAGCRHPWAPAFPRMRRVHAI